MCLRSVSEAKDCPPDYDEGLFIEVQTVKRIKANLNGRRTVPERTSKYRRNHFPRYFFVSREKGEKMSRENEDIRVEVVKSGLTYAEIAKEMKISRVWLSRVMARKLTPEMRRRINVAIDELTVSKRGRR